MNKNNYLNEITNQINKSLLPNQIELLLEGINWEELAEQLHISSPLSAELSPDKIKEEYKQALIKILDNNQENERAKKGLVLILENLGNYSNGFLCRKELEEASEIIGEERLKNLKEIDRALQELKDLDIPNQIFQSEGNPENFQQALKPEILKKIKEVGTLEEKEAEQEEKTGYLSNVNSSASELNISPTALATFYDIATNLFNDRKNEEALAVIEFLLVLDGYCCEFWISKGLCHQRLEDHFSAIYAYTMASLMDPDNLIAYFRCAECYIAIKNFEKAEGCLRMAEQFINEENREFAETTIKQFSKKI